MARARPRPARARRARAACRRRSSPTIRCSVGEKLVVADLAIDVAARRGGRAVRALQIDARDRQRQRVAHLGVLLAIERAVKQGRGLGEPPFDSSSAAASRTSASGEPSRSCASTGNATRRISLLTSTSLSGRGAGLTTCRSSGSRVRRASSIPDVRRAVGAHAAGDRRRARPAPGWPAGRRARPACSRSR